VLLNKPFNLNQAAYASQIKGDLPLLVDVWAEWCGPCKSFAPTFEQAAAQLSGRVRLAKLDSEANQQLSAQLGIRSIPSLILFKDGREVARQSGAMPLQQLLAWLNSQGV
jgi:thioredoxin 2